MVNTHELLELAALDAMGLLDPDEREAFERAFRAAPPAVQAQIRREQTRLAGMDALLPQIDPPLGLRARVLAAVREAMQAVAARRAGGPAVVGSIVPEIAAPRGVHRVWRMTAIASAAAALVFGVVTVQTLNNYDDIRAGLEAGGFSEMVAKQYGPHFQKLLLNPEARFVQFTPTRADAEPAGTGKALLVLDPGTRRAHLLLENLPSEIGDYRIVVMDKDGKVGDAVITFRGTGSGFDMKQYQDILVEGADRLAIVPAHLPMDVAVPVLLSGRL